MMVTIYLIRHGRTLGNMQHRYVGRTDEPLCEDGIRQISAQKQIYGRQFSTKGGCSPLNKVYISPMLRCKQTAELLFSGIEQEVIEDFREMDFGAFEYKNYEELNGDPRYQAFIDSGGQTDFPEAETQAHFRGRVIRAFAQCVDHMLSHQPQDAADRAYAFVVHGGTVMAILDAYAQPHRPYFDWQLPAGAGYRCELQGVPEGVYLTHIQRLTPD